MVEKITDHWNLLSIWLILHLYRLYAVLNKRMFDFRINCNTSYLILNVVNRSESGYSVQSQPIRSVQLKQWEVEGSTRSLRKRRENSKNESRPVLSLLLIGWQKGARFLNQSKRTEMQNQKQSLSLLVKYQHWPASNFS